MVRVKQQKPLSVVELSTSIFEESLHVSPQKSIRRRKSTSAMVELDSNCQNITDIVN